MQIGFIADNSWISKIVRFVTQSQISHCFLLFDSADLGGQFVLEAATDGFHIRPFIVRPNDKVILLTPKYNVDGLLHLCAHWLGEPYDMAGAIGIGWTTVGRFFKRKWNNPFQSKKALFCSEAILRSLQELNYPGSALLTPETTSPQDLLVFLEQQ